MNDPKESSGEVHVAIRWKEEERLPTLYANQLIITHASGEFYLIFGEADLPYNFILDTSPQNAPDAIEVKPVARIVLTPEVMMQFARVIQDNVNRFQERVSKSEKEE